jgi:hypothetical protein
MCSNKTLNVALLAHFSACICTSVFLFSLFPYSSFYVCLFLPFSLSFSLSLDSYVCLFLPSFLSLCLSVLFSIFILFAFCQLFNCQCFLSTSRRLGLSTLAFSSLSLSLFPVYLSLPTPLFCLCATYENSVAKRARIQSRAVLGSQVK